MKTIYKYIEFKDYSNPKNKTKRFVCMNKSHNDYLGEVSWHNAWRQYCYFANASTYYSAGCLADIQDFIKQLMDERK